MRIFHITCVATIAPCGRQYCWIVGNYSNFDIMISFISSRRTSIDAFLCMLRCKNREKVSSNFFHKWKAYVKLYNNFCTVQYNCVILNNLI